MTSFEAAVATQDERVEEIGGLLFSKWRKEPPDARLPGFSATFCFVLLGVVALILAISRHLILNPELLSAPWAKIFVGTLAFGWIPIVVLVPLLKRPRRLPHPLDAPRGAAAATVRLSPGRGAVGWLSIDREWLVFESDDFHFRLKRGDFDFKGRLAARLSRPEPFRLNFGKGYPRLGVAISFRVRQGEWLVPVETPPGFLSDLEAWEQAEPSSEWSIYPPIRPPDTPIPWAKHVRRALVPSAVAGLVTALAPVIVPLMPEGPPSIGMTVGFFVMGFLLLFSILISPAFEASTTRSEARKALKKLEARSRVEYLAD